MVLENCLEFHLFSPTSILNQKHKHCCYCVGGSVDCVRWYESFGGMMYLNRRGVGEDGGNVFL
jgi:hypothetical protein